MQHWIDELAEKLLQYLESHFDKISEPIILNGGLSVSGLQHVGRLRGEITLNSALRYALEERGYKVKQFLTLYTQDEWKGKKPQIEAFDNPSEARKYIGFRLIDVPDPKGCHKNWVEHFWDDFGGVLDHFAPDVNVITTTQLYKDKLKKYVKIAIQKADRVREIINKYRKRKPFPENWLPLLPRCEKCGRIGKAKILEVNLDKYTVKYRCECGFEGESSIETGKLNWRIEWSAIWAALGVHFEPYGKDHAAPGGSRDSASELSIEIFGREPPFGTPYEWVGVLNPDRTKKVMGSSDFVGFTPRQWYEVAEPEVLRYIYLTVPIMKQVFLGLHKVPEYTNNFDFGERIYFGEESAEDVEEIKRAYELAVMYNKPQRCPFRLSFSHAALLVQVISEENFLEEAIARLKETGILKKELDLTERKLLETRLNKAKNWVKYYAPDNMRISIISFEESIKIAKDAILLVKDKSKQIKMLIDKFTSIPWALDAIKESMKEITATFDDNKAIKDFFRALYLVFLGKSFGPRMAPLLTLLQREDVIRRIKLLI